MIEARLSTFSSDIPGVLEEKANFVSVENI
jgi:hypothetical protein